MSHVWDMSIPPATPRPRDRSGTETAIIEAARRLLLRDGWTALNVQALAAEAGVDRKLIYRYFTDLDGVVERLAGRPDIWLGQALAEQPPSTATTYRAFMRESVLAYLHVLRTQPLVLRMLAWEIAQDTPLPAAPGDGPVPGDAGLDGCAAPPDRDSVRGRCGRPERGRPGGGSASGPGGRRAAPVRQSRRRSRQ